MTDRFLDEDWSSDAFDSFSTSGETEIQDITKKRNEETQKQRLSASGF